MPSTTSRKRLATAILRDDDIGATAALHLANDTIAIITQVSREFRRAIDMFSAGAR